MSNPGQFSNTITQQFLRELLHELQSVQKVKDEKDMIQRHNNRIWDFVETVANFPYTREDTRMHDLNMVLWEKFGDIMEEAV